MTAGKTALVTGSSGGIGKAIATKFGEHGMNVVVNYASNQDGAKEAAETIRDAGGNATVVGADVSDPAEAQALVETAREEYGTVDVLVNNAGIYPRYDWESITWDRLQQVLSVNVGGLCNVSGHVLPEMADRGDGVVINMSSIWSQRGGTGNVAYTASKGAITALTRQMCAEYGGEGVRVNTITPGAIATPMNEARREDEEYLDRVTEGIPANRFGSADEIAGVALFLAGPDATYVNGADIVVDGGLLAV